MRRITGLFAAFLRRIMRYYAVWQTVQHSSGEAINLKIKDIDSKRMQIRIEQSKGKKDRYTLLSQKALLLLREYYQEYKPVNYLFEGQDSPTYSAKSIQLILKRACEQAGIKKHVTLHTLRH